MDLAQLDEMIKCVARELALRRNVYPRWINAGRMSAEKADREIATMELVRQTLENLKNERAKNTNA